MWSNPPTPNIPYLRLDVTILHIFKRAFRSLLILHLVRLDPVTLEISIVALNDDSRDAMHGEELHLYPCVYIRQWAPNLVEV